MSSSPEINESPASNAIRVARERYNEAIVKRDVAAIASLLAPEYHVVTGRSAQSHGVEEQRRRWAEVFEKDHAAVYRRTPREIRVNELWGLAEELGNWAGSYSAEMATASASGVYAAKWQRAENGAWLVQAEVFTTLECSGPAGGCMGPDPIAG